MIIDNQIDGLTCDITGNFLDIYLDENNNSFSNIDNLPNNSNATLNQTTSISTIYLPKSIFSFKSNVMQCIDYKIEIDENNDNLPDERIQFKNSKLDQQQLTKQSVKRALFVEKDKIDHEANLKLVRNQMEQLEKQDSEKWNFDFKNNCPLNTLNSRYEWFKANNINEPVLSKLDLNQKNHLKTSSNSNLNSGFKSIDKKTESNAILQSVSSYHCEYNNRTGTRSIKRKLNINDYFQPTKKRTSNLLKDQTPTKSTDLLPINKNVNYVQNEIKITNETTKPVLRSFKLQHQQIKQLQPIKQSLKRKCKKTRTTPPKQRNKQKKSLEKVTKRQTTLKF